MTAASDRVTAYADYEAARLAADGDPLDAYVVDETPDTVLLLSDLVEVLDDRRRARRELVDLRRWLHVTDGKKDAAQAALHAAEARHGRYLRSTSARIDKLEGRIAKARRQRDEARDRLARIRELMSPEAALAWLASHAPDDDLDAPTDDAFIRLMAAYQIERTVAVRAILDETSHT
jgi:hypothetical protein